MKVLFTTGYARNAIVHHGRLDQGVELLTKPFTRSQLASRIRSVLDAPAAQKTVLIVEDEEMVRMFLADTLAYQGFDVISAESASAALIAAKSRPRIDLAIVDMGLPDRNGLEIAQELRTQWPHMMVVIASGYGDRLPEKLREDPLVTFLPKPYNEEALKVAFARLGLEV
jgi:CheY-like chemotaxis protein